MDFREWTMIEFDDMELMQLKFCIDQTKSQMSIIAEKVEVEMERRKNDTGVYTPKYVSRQLTDEIENLRSQIDVHIKRLEDEV